MIAAGETIAAIATPPGRGAIAIVRCSGPAARQIAAVVFRGGVLHDRVATYGTIVDPSGRAIDRGMAIAMDAPRSATGETVLELHVHGSPIVARETLQALIAAGARLAEPGEFTRRGYLNGKLDLAAAEAVADLIDAESRAAVHAATANLSAGLERLVDSIRTDLAQMLEELAGAVDFPDEVDEPNAGAFAERLRTIVERLRALLHDAERGRLVREGLALAIVGPPNAGKSSLLNALVGEERAIVSPHAGTTRDTIEESFTIAGVHVRAIDTAGLRKSDDPLERAGIERAQRALAAATVALVVIDGSQQIPPEGAVIVGQTRLRPRVVFFNKRDCGTRGYDEREASEVDALCGSVFDSQSVDALRTAIAQVGWNADRFDLTRPHLAGLRQIDAATQAIEALSLAEKTLQASAPIDLIVGDLIAASAALAQISGGAATEALLDGIFARFCIGK